MVSRKKSVTAFVLALFALLLSWSVLFSFAQGNEETAKPPALDAKMRAEVVKE